VTKRIVAIDLANSIAVLSIDNPPVNALGSDLRTALASAFEALGSNADVRGIIIRCEGASFITGADIKEFGTPKQLQAPLLPDLCRQIEALDKPVLASMHGTALGGGLEIALACHYRVALEGTKFGLPEVKLGLIPGSGGTVRLPRLVGPELAVEMIASGRPIDCTSALTAGLVDAVADVDLTSFSRAFMQEKLRDHRPVQALRTSAREDKIIAVRSAPDGFVKLASALEQKSKRLPAQLAAIQSVRNAVAMPFQAAVAEERRLFEGLVASPESKALRHLFFAERAAFKSSPSTSGVRKVDHVSVVGAGTMGIGIALAFASAGLSVRLIDTSEASLERGMQKIRDTLDKATARGALSGSNVPGSLGGVEASTCLESVETSDLIVEAVFEDMLVKTDVFGKLGLIARQGAIIATNTSYLNVDEIAEASGRPQDVVGLHFFSPANIMRLLEVVRGAKTSPEVLASVIELAKRIGKLPVVVGVGPGFVGNRMLLARNAENENLLLEGATPEQIDKAFTDFGWAMGPFQVSDVAGLDISWRNRKAKGVVSPIADALCESGRFGQKSGRGWYRYEQGSRTPLADPEVHALIARQRSRNGGATRPVSTEEILRRTMGPLIAEGHAVLREGIARNSADIDLIWVNGYGFPPTKGGPMYWAAAEGL